jgi:hypothetical protein
VIYSGPHSQFLGGLGEDLIPVLIVRPELFALAGPGTKLQSHSWSHPFPQDFPFRSLAANFSFSVNLLSVL